MRPTTTITQKYFNSVTRFIQRLRQITIDLG